MFEYPRLIYKDCCGPEREGVNGWSGVGAMVVLMVLLSSVVLAAAVPAAVGNGWQLTQPDRMMQLMIKNRMRKR